MIEMPRHTVYSFSDLSGAIAHPLVGSYSFTGQGVGQIGVIFNIEETSHEIDVNGIVLVTKIPAFGGRLQIQCQQVSNIHKWLLSTYLKVSSAKVMEWARMAATLRNMEDGTQRDFKGMSFGKVPDTGYAAQGTMLTWNLFFAASTSSIPA